MSFDHIFMRDWSIDHEVLPYPPAVGPYAVYTRDDFFAHMNHAIAKVSQMIGSMRGFMLVQYFHQHYIIISVCTSYYVAVLAQGHGLH